MDPPMSGDRHKRTSERPQQCSESHRTDSRQSHHETLASHSFSLSVPSAASHSVPIAELRARISRSVASAGLRAGVCPATKVKQLCSTQWNRVALRMQHTHGLAAQPCQLREMRFWVTPSLARARIRHWVEQIRQPMSAHVHWPIQAHVLTAVTVPAETGIPESPGSLGQAVGL